MWRIEPKEKASKSQASKTSSNFSKRAFTAFPRSSSQPIGLRRLQVPLNVFSIYLQILIDSHTGVLFGWTRRVGT